MNHIIHANRNDHIKVSEFCPERAYLEIQVPENAERVEKLVIHIRSHDQGYCSDEGMVGKPGYTWFEANVATSTGRNNIARRLISRNTAAEYEWQDYHITLEPLRSEESERPFVEELRALDIVQIIPKARWTGWVNYVRAIDVEIHCKTKTSQSSQPSENRKPLYGTLDHSLRTIRLLVVQPGSGADSISCELITTSILNDENIDYEALSYCWGEDRKMQTIYLCQQNEAVRSVDVSSSVYGALIHLRRPSTNRILWIDSVCINQADSSECADQVSMMGEIYSRAQAVLVWLGDGNADTRAAADDLRNIFPHYQVATEEEIAQGTSRGFLPYVDASPDGSTRIPGLLDRLSRFFSLPWFWRTWVVQEAWLSQKAIFHFGHDVIEWDLIWKANSWMNIRGFNTPGVEQIALPLIWSALKKLSERSEEVDSDSSLKLGLLDLVLQSLDLKATDPRDKIFALLGLAKETYSEQVSQADLLLYPNYTKSVSAVFADFTRWWILKYKSLKILSTIHATRGRTWQSLHCTGGSTAEPHDQPPIEHPTWSLWHSGRSKWISEGLGYSGSYKASGTTHVVVELVMSPENSSHLKLRGVHLGTILNISPFSWGNQPAEICDTFNRLFDASGSRRIWNNPVTTNLKLNEGGWDDIGRHCVAHGNEETYWEDDCSLPCLDDCFCRISGDLVGLCPAGTKASDLIVILYGGSVPYILRERNANEYEFVGECYVYGMMDGRALVPSEGTALKEKDFILI